MPEEEFFSDVQKYAWTAFKQAALKEQDNGSETLSLFRQVPLFSTASEEETRQTMVCMRYWSRRGMTGALLQSGEELLHGGYGAWTRRPGNG